MPYGYFQGRESLAGPNRLLRGSNSGRVAFLWSSTGFLSDTISLGLVSSGGVEIGKRSTCEVYKPFACDYPGVIGEPIYRQQTLGGGVMNYVDIWDSDRCPPFQVSNPLGILAASTVTIVGFSGSHWYKALGSNQQRRTAIISARTVLNGPQLRFGSAGNDAVFGDGLYWFEPFELTFRYCDLGDIVRGEIYFYTGPIAFQNVHCTEIYDECQSES